MIVNVKGPAATDGTMDLIKIMVVVQGIICRHWIIDMEDFKTIRNHRIGKFGLGFFGQRYIDQDYAEVAYKAMAGLLEQIDETGEVQKVSIGTGMGDSLAFYRNVGLTAMPYGQSLSVLAFTELLVSYC